MQENVVGVGAVRALRVSNRRNRKKVSKNIATGNNTYRNYK